MSFINEHEEKNRILKTVLSLMARGHLPGKEMFLKLKMKAPGAHVIKVKSSIWEDKRYGDVSPVCPVKSLPMKKPTAWPLYYDRMGLPSMVSLILVFFGVLIFLFLLGYIFNGLASNSIVFDVSLHYSESQQIYQFGFGLIILLSLLAFLSCCSFGWIFVYFDSKVPGIDPPFPSISRKGINLDLLYLMPFLTGVFVGCYCLWFLSCYQFS